MTIISDRQETNNTLAVVIISLFAVIIYPVAIITIVFIILFKRLKINSVIPVLSLLLILIIWTYFSPSLLYSLVQNFCGNIISLCKSQSISELVSNMITYGFAYSLSDWLILLCFSAITALITADILNERVRQIKPLEEDMKDVEGANQNHTHKKGRDKHYMIPQNLTGKTIIGSSGNKPIATEDSARHIFCCGTTGSGKTVLLSNYIESGMKQNYPMMIIDGKGDIGKGSINEIVHHFAGKRKVYIIDMNQPENSDKYNPFQNTNPTICKDMIINMTDWTEVHYKSNTERYVQRVIQLMKLCGIPFSFANIVKYMDAERFMQISGQAVKNGMLTKEDHLETINICKASGEIARDASARFSTIMESELGTIFDESGIDIYGALRKNAVILFILNPLLYPEVSQLLGRLILIDAKKAVSNFFAQPIPRIFYIMDEINVYASPTLIDLINKSRSANITCIAATQSLADLEYSAGDAFKQQLIENCNNYIVMRQNSAKSAEEWANILGTRQAIEITHQLGNHQNISVPTGYGSAKRTRKYHYHPDEIKALMTGEAIYMSKDSMTHKRIKVRKGF